MHPTLPDLQAVILSLFETSLGRPVGADEDFFALGGDSLAAEQVLSALSETLQQDLPGWILLDHPSARRLAEALVG